MTPVSPRSRCMYHIIEHQRSLSDRSEEHGVCVRADASRRTVGRGSGELGVSSYVTARYGHRFNESMRLPANT